MAIEEGELLRAMGRIVGRVQVEGNTPGPAMQPAAMTFEEAAGFPIVYLTAHHMLLFVGNLRPGARVVKTT